MSNQDQLMAPSPYEQQKRYQESFLFVGIYDAKDVRAETAAGGKIDEGNAHHTL
jgi:hypothetical protein